MNRRSSTASTAVRRRRFPVRVVRVLRFHSLSLLLVWALLILLFGLLRPSTFFTAFTFRTVAADQAITAIMALALVIPLAAGVFDLSIGGMMGMSVVLVTWFQSAHQIDPASAIVLTLLAGLLVGAINAVVIVRLGVDSFIATLGMQSILLAAIQWVSGGNQIVTGISEGFKRLGGTKLFGLPLPFYYMLGIAAVLWYVLELRQFGRYLYATGANPEAVRLAGVRTGRLTTVSLLVSATVATLAGIIFAAKIGSASLDAGPPYLLPAFAAVFLGATQFRSRLVNVPGTIIAVYVLATGVKGLQLTGSPFWVEDLFNGLALIVAVALAVQTSRRRSSGEHRGEGGHVRAVRRLTRKPGAVASAPPRAPT